MKAIKIGFWILMVLVVVAVAGVVIVTQTINPNDYKPEIRNLVKEKTGRDIDIPGELGLTFFPWLGVTTGEVALASAEGFGDEPMLSVDNAEVRVKLMPLIRREVEVDTVILDAPRLRLYTNEDGVNNWDDLLGASGAQPEQNTDQPVAIAALAVQGVSVKDGLVNWQNAQTNQSLTVSSLDLDTGKLVPGDPLDVKLSLDAEGSMLPEAGSVAIDTTITLGEKMAMVYLEDTDLELNAESLSASMNIGEAEYGMDQQLLMIRKMEGSAKHGEQEANLNLPALDANLGTMGINMPEAVVTSGDDRIALEVNASGSDPATRQMDGKADIAIADLRALLARFGQEGLLNSYTTASLKNVKGGATFQLKGPQIAAQDIDLNASINDLATSFSAESFDYNTESQSIALPSLALTQEDMRLALTLNGKGILTEGKGRSANGSIELRVVDLANLVARNGVQAALPELPVNDIDLQTNFALEGDRLTASRLATEFAYEGNSTTVAAQKAAFNIASGALELDQLKIEQGDADVAISATGQNTLDGVAAMKLSGNVSAEAADVPGLLARNGVEVALPEGVVTDAKASGSFGLSDNNLSLTELDLNTANMQVNGEATIRNLSAPAYRFDLEFDRLDVDRLTASAGNGESEQPSTAQQVLLPVAPLQGLNVDGRARIGELVTTGLTLTNVDATIKADENVLRITPVKANLFGGTLESNLRYDVSGDVPNIDTNSQVRDVKIGELLTALEVTDKVAGRGDLTSDLRGRGADVDGFIASLAGDIRFKLLDGAIQGYDLQAALLDIERAMASFAGQAAESVSRPGAETKFAEMSGSFDANKGVFRNEDFDMKAPLFRVNGGGEINLPKERIDYQMNVHVVKSVEGQGGVGLEALDDARIPLKIYGPLAEPKISLDLASLVQAEAMDALQKEGGKLLEKELGEELGKQVGDLLPGLLGGSSGGTSGQSADQNANQPSEQQAEQSQPAPEQPVEQDPQKALEENLKKELKEGLLKGLGF